jgi:hypothetical protein
MACERRCASAGRRQQGFAPPRLARKDPDLIPLAVQFSPSHRFACASVGRPQAAIQRAESDRFTRTPKPDKAIRQTGRTGRAFRTESRCTLRIDPFTAPRRIGIPVTTPIPPHRASTSEDSVILVIWITKWITENPSRQHGCEGHCDPEQPHTAAVARTRTTGFQRINTLRPRPMTEYLEKSTATGTPRSWRRA